MSTPSEYLSVCAIFRDEAPYLREWIEFHKLVGVTRFFMYDNGSTDESRDVLAPYVAAGEVEIEDWPGVAVQIDAYMDCVRRRRDESRWIAFIDLDEFLFSPTGRPLPELLVDFEAFPGVGVNWVNFGTSGHVTKPPGLVIENYLYARSNPRTRRRIKSIADPRRVVGCDHVHFFRYVEGTTVNEQKRPIRGSESDEPSTELLRINHYVTKSEEERRAKVARRRADTGEFRPQRRPPSAGKVRDEAVLIYLPRLRHALAQASPATG